MKINLSINKAISLLLILIYLIGIITSILIAFYGGSGGETTEPVFNVLAITNIAGFCVSVLIVIFKRDWYSIKRFWLFILLVFLTPISFNYCKNVLNNHFKKLYKTEHAFDNNVSQEKIEVIKDALSHFCKTNESGKDLFVDTILYCIAQEKALVLAHIKVVNDNLLELYPNSKFYYQNYDLIGYMDDDTQWDFYKIERNNIIVVDTSVVNLKEKIKKWYTGNWSCAKLDKQTLK